MKTLAHINHTITGTLTTYFNKLETSFDKLGRRIF